MHFHVRGHNVCQCGVIILHIKSLWYKRKQVIFKYTLQMWPTSYLFLFRENSQRLKMLLVMTFLPRFQNLLLKWTQNCGFRFTFLAGPLIFKKGKIKKLLKRKSACILTTSDSFLWWTVKRKFGFSELSCSASLDTQHQSEAEMKTTAPKVSIFVTLAWAMSLIQHQKHQKPKKE